MLWVKTVADVVVGVPGVAVAAVALDRRRRDDLAECWRRDRRASKIGVWEKHRGEVGGGASRSKEGQTSERGPQGYHHERGREAPRRLRTHGEDHESPTTT